MAALHRITPRRPVRLAMALLGAALLVLCDGAPGAASDEAPVAGATAPLVTGETSEQEAAVVAAEDRRLVEVRTVTSLARWQGKNWKTPYRLGTAAGYTLVLTPRSEPYTVADLTQLAPRTFVPMSDGSYLLTEHLVVLPNATLQIGVPGGMTLRLGSGPQGFATIVSLGGALEFVGEDGAPVHVLAWDATAGEADTILVDGRAYVRAIGGQFTASHASFTDLGFWSGRTGGLALTGTDRPNTGAIETGAVGAERTALLDGVTWQPADAVLAPTTLGDDFLVAAQDYVSGDLRDVVSARNAFGLFVSGANGIQVLDSEFRANALGGVTLHRYVTNGVIAKTVSSANRGDGIALDRATTGITLSEVTASENEGSGIRLAGRPLADGPSAVGASLRSYGNNAVSNSTALNNGRYGIEILGGVNIAVSNNTVVGHDMGIMVNGPAERVSLTGNAVRQSSRHGLALVNGVIDSTVTGNVVDGATTGVYLRDSVASVTGNTVLTASSHGVTLVGEVGGAEISANVVSGTGTTAIDIARADGEVLRRANNLTDWRSTQPWYSALFRQLLHPMTGLWSVLGALLLVSAVRGRRTRAEVVVHPYAHQTVRPGRVAVPHPPSPSPVGAPQHVRTG